MRGRARGGRGRGWGFKRCFLFFVNSLILINFFINKYDSYSTCKFLFQFLELCLANFTILFGIAPKLRNIHFVTNCGDDHIYHGCLLISMQMLLY